MLKNSQVKLLVLFLLLFLFLGASFILAQKPLEVTYPELPGVKTPTTTKEALPDYIRYVFHLGLFLAGLLAFGSFVYGGFRYLTSGGSPAVQKDAVSQITSGFLGLAILIFTFVLLNMINPQLTAFNVSLPHVPLSNLVVSLPKIGATNYLEIPLGGLIENLWGRRSPTYPSGFKPIDCYDFDTDGINPSGDAVGLLTNHDRLDCIKELSAAIKVKAEKLKEPVEELSRYYTCDNCCEDCCNNVCSNWVTCADICDEGGVWPWWQWENCEGTCCQGTQNEGCWGSCGPYDCCEGLGMDGWKNFCPGLCCEYFQECKCEECLGSICRYPEDKKTICNYTDLIIQDLIEQIKEALIEFQVKMGFFPLTEKMRKSDNLDLLLSVGNTKTLIKNLLLYQEPGYSQIDKDKLKNILKIKEVMTYLINEWPYRALLLDNQNLVKTMARILGLLENEVAINEIAWMGTIADENQEWLELYNNTNGGISLDGWQLKAADGSPEIPLSGQIPAQGFYLLENDESATNLPAGSIFSGNLNNDGEILELYDQFGNLVERVNCQTGWFAGEKNPATSMERINPQGRGSDYENWLNNLSSDVKEEQKKDFINGADQDGNPIYGTPKEPNSNGLRIASYPSLELLAYEISAKIISEEETREKLILFLRKDENLEKIMKGNEEFLGDVLMGDDDRLKRLLKEREVLKILFEDEGNLNTILADSHIEELFRQLLNMEEPEKDAAWQDLIANKLTEVVTNSKIISDFEKDLSWVVEAGDIMQECAEDPISIDQARVPEFISGIVIEKVPEWEEIETGLKLPGETETSHDPAIFYCHKLLW